MLFRILSIVSTTRYRHDKRSLSNPSEGISYTSIEKELRQIAVAFISHLNRALSNYINVCSCAEHLFVCQFAGACHSVQSIHTAV